MRSKRSRFALAGVLALALGAFAGPGVANAAKVTESAGPVAVPNATDAGPGFPIVAGETTLEFELKGEKVKKKQTLDVNVIVNSTGSAPGTNDDLLFRLFGPKGDSVGFAVDVGQSMAELKFDQQSRFIDCNPLGFQASDCNYPVGAVDSETGTLVGSIRIDFNQEFKGVNPKGTWSLLVQDRIANARSATLGETTLEVKTGKKFAKEDK